MCYASRPSRVVNVSSEAHRFGVMNVKNINLKGEYNDWKAYGQSKLANVMFTFELAKRLPASIRLDTNCLHPGVVETELWRCALNVTVVCTSVDNGCSLDHMGCIELHRETEENACQLKSKHMGCINMHEARSVSLHMHESCTAECSRSDPSSLSAGCLQFRSKCLGSMVHMFTAAAHLELQFVPNMSPNV
jgi:hypothetical protein